MSRTRIVRALSCIALAATLITVTDYALAAKPKVRLTMEAAREIALAKEAGDIKSQELEKEKGRWIYSFDIERDKQIHEVGVDANTGKIVEDSTENPADEAKEKDQQHQLRNEQHSSFPRGGIHAL
jgi:Peptidase propeptide and YPEB domain